MKHKWLLLLLLLLLLLPVNIHDKNIIRIGLDDAQATRRVQMGQVGSRSRGRSSNSNSNSQSSHPHGKHLLNCATRERLPFTSRIRMKMGK
jgi:hypothetical protein